MNRHDIGTDDIQRLTNAEMLAIVRAAQAAHYEFVCLEPRLSGSFQKNARALKEALALALKPLQG